MSKTMKAAQISKAQGDWELVERELPQPGPKEVRVKIEACGICHSDVLVKDGVWPGLKYPRVPGHEIAGRVDEVGSDVSQWSKGQRVGVGWHGGHCFICDPCRRGDFAMCVNRKVTGIDFDGGYAEYVVVPAEAIAAIPESAPERRKAVEQLNAAGNQAFEFIGKGLFTGNAGDPDHRGELRYVVTADGVTLLGDVDGNSVADLAINVSIVSVMKVTDFIL